MSSPPEHDRIPEARLRPQGRGESARRAGDDAARWASRHAGYMGRAARAAAPVLFFLGCVGLAATTVATRTHSPRIPDVELQLQQLEWQRQQLDNTMRLMEMQRQIDLQRLQGQQLYPPPAGELRDPLAVPAYPLGVEDGDTDPAQPEPAQPEPAE